MGTYLSQLSVLFPFVNLRNQFHIDHVFPQARFKPVKLKADGFSDAEIKEMAALAQQLPNLQLLESDPNSVEKRDHLPAAWLSSSYPGQVERAHYCSQHLLGDVPSSLKDFRTFYDVRRELLRERLLRCLRQGADFSD